MSSFNVSLQASVFDIFNSDFSLCCKRNVVKLMMDHEHVSSVFKSSPRPRFLACVNALRNLSLYASYCHQIREEKTMLCSTRVWC